MNITATTLINSADLAEIVVANAQVHQELYTFNPYGVLLCRCGRPAVRVYGYAADLNVAALMDCGDHDAEDHAGRLSRWIDDARAEVADRLAYPEEFATLRAPLWLTYDFRPVA
jgi:hypothetical protein